jgi:Tfp pilus assembly protein PilV
MLEVLIAILVITFFLAGTLQLMAIDTLYKVLAKQQANAAQWIQEDVEEVRALASTIARNDTLCTPTTASPASYASELQTAITNSTTLPGSTSKPLLSPNSKPYQMTRTYTIATDQPSVLKITYGVVDTNASNRTNQDINRSANSTVARFYTEVIPAASFQCP